MKKKSFRVLLLIIAAVAVICIGSGIFLFLQLVFTDESFDVLIERTDNYYSLAYYEPFRHTLENAFGKAANAGQYLSVLKRMVLYSNKSSNWAWSKKFAFSALNKLPGNDSILYFFMYTALKDKDYEKCLEVFNKKT